MIEPEYLKLVTWFKNAPQWQSVCPHLLDDKDGSKTEEISMMQGGVKEKCMKCLRGFLRYLIQLGKELWML